jgi:hypothetical protein
MVQGVRAGKSEDRGQMTEDRRQKTDRKERVLSVFVRVSLWQKIFVVKRELKKWINELL